DQDDFYNMVVSGQVLDEENPFEFLKKINKIEADFGRDRTKEIRFGPRSLDIDIEIFGNQKINTEILQIPHPRVKERAFVLYPLLEVLKKNADDLLVKEYESYLKNVDSSSIEKIN
ncbi:MAG: 2-amino-4-hydroxy-6-hydroxymethyldihydropteridine diphosphokinase, partial [Treponema sp.]|nr:2-amino-4-hydroxy-6-hydroxymethyldihydropteridine diphosphokinase [Treponema sp.]